jgi:hypothetical protein
VATFLYIDYGPSPDIALELKYSLATLLAETTGAEPDIVVYTDKPWAYAGLHPKLTTRTLGDDLARWSRDGLYKHRVKPCALLNALQTISDACVLVDTDTFFRAGFATALREATAAGGAAMDQFERRDPCPACARIETTLPHAGRYAYVGATVAMYNSGLVAANRARHAAALEDAIALIDAWLNAGIRQENIEQIAVSEAFRLHGETIAEMTPLFAHYYLRSQKLYMRPRIAAWLKRSGGLTPTRPFLEPSMGRVRWARIIDRWLGRN